MRASIKNSITAFFLVAGVIATYFIIKSYGWKAIFDTYKNLDPLTVLFYLFVIFIIFVTLTWRWNVILKSRKIKVPFWKLFIYRIIGTSINFLTPGPRVGGEPTQATLLTKHKVDFTEGLSTIMIDKIIDTTTNGLLFILGVLLVGIKYSFSRNAEIALIIGGGVFIWIVWMFYYRMLTNKHFFLNIFRVLRLDKIKSLKKVESGIEKIELIMIEFYKGNKKAFLKALSISMFTWVLMFVEYRFATQLLGFNLGIVEMFFIITFIGMAQLFPIPMAIGVLEAGQISAFNLINLNGSAGVALAFIVRSKDIIVAIIGLILLATYGFHVTSIVEDKYRKKIPKESSKQS